ncbi:MAG: hypothetical protein JXA16_00995 [Bacteroidales bacterium]|nr:hypothetical protein [Bacteroidales bacterium]
MSKYAIINVPKIRAWIFDRKIEKRIKKANRLREMTKYKYMVILVSGKPLIYKKADLKRLISMRVFKKGTTIKDIEKRAIYITV